jgi:hypothetical protein
MKNYDDETTYKIYFNGMIREIRDTSANYKELELVDRSL